MNTNRQKSLFNRAVEKIRRREKPTPEEVQAILDATDWTDYWRRGDEEIAKECEAYRRASARSLERDGHRIFLCPA